MSAGISAASHDPGVGRYRSSSGTIARSRTLVQTRTPTISYAPIATAPQVGQQPGGDDEQEDRQHRRQQEHGNPDKKVPHVAASPRAGHDPRPSAPAPPGRTDGAPLCTLFTTRSPALI